VEEGALRVLAFFHLGLGIFRACAERTFRYTTAKTFAPAVSQKAQALAFGGSFPLVGLSAAGILRALCKARSQPSLRCLLAFSKAYRP